MTGASSGIGTALTREATRLCHDLLLVARDEVRLAGVGADVATRATVIAADLGDPQGPDRVEQLVRDRRPSLVVSCAAAGRHGPLDAQTPEDLDALVAVNVLAPLRLTAAALRIGTAVINVSSTASDAEVPLLAPYVASEAFLESMSMSISVPTDRHGPPTPVTVVRPGYTRTAFHRRLGEDVSDVPPHHRTTPDDIGRRALDAHEAGLRRSPSERPRPLPQAADVSCGAFGDSLFGELSFAYPLSSSRVHGPEGAAEGDDGVEQGRTYAARASRGTTSRGG